MSTPMSPRVAFTIPLSSEKRFCAIWSVPGSTKSKLATNTVVSQPRFCWKCMLPFLEQHVLIPKWLQESWEDLREHGSASNWDCILDNFCTIFHGESSLDRSTLGNNLDLCRPRMCVGGVQTTGPKDLVLFTSATGTSRPKCTIGTHSDGHCTVSCKQSGESGNIGCDDEPSLTGTPSRVQKVEHEVTRVLFCQCVRKSNHQPPKMLDKLTMSAMRWTCVVAVRSFSTKASFGVAMSWNEGKGRKI
jgi:hypothetical protein